MASYPCEDAPPESEQMYIPVICCDIMRKEKALYMCICTRDFVAAYMQPLRQRQLCQSQDFFKAY